MKCPECDSPGYDTLIGCVDCWPAKKRNSMNLYHIQFDSVSFWVEAESFAKAIEAWKRHVSKEWGTDYDGTEEPESCHKIHDEAVIR